MSAMYLPWEKPIPTVKESPDSSRAIIPSRLPPGLLFGTTCGGLLQVNSSQLSTYGCSIYLICTRYNQHRHAQPCRGGIVFQR